MIPLFGEYNASDVLWLGNWGPGWIALLVVLGVTILALNIYDLRPLPPKRRWTLVGLRAAVYLFAVLMLLEPAVDLKHITKVKNDVFILVDESMSMSLKADESDETRFKRALESVRSLKLPKEGFDDDHNYHVLAVGESSRSIAVDTLDSLKPETQKSDIGTALGALSENTRTPLGGVVLISDGIDTSGMAGRTQRDEELDETTQQAISLLGAPINTIATGELDTLRDAAIKKVSRDDFAFVHNKVSIDVDLQVVGFERTTMPVRLERDGVLLQTRDLAINPEESDYRVTFEFVPERIGREIYRVSVPEFKDEILLTNNESLFIQKVIRDKIRTLHVVGRPSWDQRYLRRILKRNPNIDLISFFILRTPENPQLAPNSELSLIPFPTDELFSSELGSFDLIIFQNFNFGPYSMRQYLPNIEKFVRDGGGFVMVGGELSFGNGGYAGTAIEDLLPVRLPKSTSNAIDTSDFRPLLTEAGLRHPITQLAFDPSSNQELWENLPAQRGTNLVLEAKEHATVLATHPRLSAGGKPMPVIAVGAAGAGRVMALTTDSSWRWSLGNAAQGGTSREYQMFWNSTMRWLIQDPELKLLRLEIEADEIEPDSHFTGKIRVFNSDYSPAPNIRGDLVISRMPFSELGGKSARPPELIHHGQFETDSSGVFDIQLQVPKEGVYSIKANATTPSGDLTDKDVFLVVSQVKEFRDILPREDLLEAISKHTEGKHFRAPPALADLHLKEPTTFEVNRRKVIHVWDSAWVFLIILALLGTEWVLRRRWGRL